MSFDDYRPCTTFAGGNPFLGMPKKPQETQMETPKPPAFEGSHNKLTKRSATRRSLPNFEICSDPIIQRRAPSGMYAKVLASLKPGDCIKCSTEDVGKISNAMRDLVANNKTMTGLCIRETRDYGDGMGRVWLIKREK